MTLLAHISQLVIGFLMVFITGGITALQLYKLWYGEITRASGTGGAIFVLVCFGAYFAYQTSTSAFGLGRYLDSLKQQKRDDTP